MQSTQFLNNILLLIMLILWRSVLATSSNIKTKLDTSTIRPSSPVPPTTLNATTIELMTLKTTTAPSMNVTEFPNVTTSTFPPLSHNISQGQNKECHKNATLPSTTKTDEDKKDTEKNTDSTTPSSNSSHVSTTAIPQIGERFGSGYTSTFPPLIHFVEQPSSAAVEDEQKKPGASTSIKMGRCPWAILGCCVDRNGLRGTVEDCLDFLGCSGPFWDKKPCDAIFVDMAIETAYQRHKSGGA